MANKHQHHGSPLVLQAIGLTMVVFGAAYVVLTAILLSNTDLSIDYAHPVLNELGTLSQEELIIMAITGDVILVIAGAFGMIFDYGILRMKQWAWAANVIYNIIFTFLCAEAFATNTHLPDSYLIVVSIGLLVPLFMPSTRQYFKQAQIIR